MKNAPNIYFENKNHTPYDFPYNTYLCSIPLDFHSVKLHWHNEVELIVVKKGRGIVSVDLVTYYVEAGDIIFIFPGQLHSIEQDDSYRMEYENILFKQELLKSSGIDYCNANFIQPLFVGEVRLYPLIDDAFINHSRIIDLINEIDRLCDKKPFAWQMAVKGFLYQILYLLVSAYTEEVKNKSDKKSIDKIKDILTYIEQNYASPISIAEVADYCSYSESYFMKFFKQNMGSGFIQYLNQYRLELAADLLRSSNDSVLDIATAVGFDNLSYFTRSFKKKYGVTPGRYRKIPT